MRVVLDHLGNQADSLGISDRVVMFMDDDLLVMALKVADDAMAVFRVYYIIVLTENKQSGDVTRYLLVEVDLEWIEIELFLA